MFCKSKSHIVLKNPAVKFTENELKKILKCPITLASSDVLWVCFPIN